jgi:hypothetical protein
MSKSIIIDVFRGKYVTAQLVDETTELTVENNVYSLAEATELEQELLEAMYALRKHILSEVAKTVDYDIFSSLTKGVASMYMNMASRSENIHDRLWSMYI